VAADSRWAIADMTPDRLKHQSGVTKVAERAKRTTPERCGNTFHSYEPRRCTQAG
jgi:hypothetical protein